IPQQFKAQLRPYQHDGVNWLQFLREYEFNGILADDMGLGKTVQALCHIAIEKTSGRMDKPCLVVAPTSLMFNWRMEAERFYPDLKVIILQGAERKQLFDSIHTVDLVLTTYPLLSRDKDMLLNHEFHMLILDEAQFIKNAKSLATQIVQQIKAKHRLCLTGTPLENHLGELWSLINFLMPGLLGNAKKFTTEYRNPIEKLGNMDRHAHLIRRIAPFLLRRTKDKVVLELPEKIEMIRHVELEGPQRDLYETIRVAMQEKVQEQISRLGLARGHIVILDALLKLRQVCCDPRLLKISTPKNKASGSAKLELLMSLLPELLEEGRRILLFSQFTEMLGLIEQELDQQKIPYVKLTGQTKDRMTPVQRFQDGEIPLFLISLKAGGTGLNLTAADTVIHYDPWWNPAVENQATDRAHRIGQQKTVFVYKLVAKGTIEEKILLMQQQKHAVMQSLFTDATTSKQSLNKDDLQTLFDPFVEAD
ncbi:MAG: DEAD/DEAH box helicase, partial [Pseudomonadota bacterium]|nr:DEAD/DEAH box helicase [Pseudomonadota bacterium]